MALMPETIKSEISIHAPREGGDAVESQSDPVQAISIHAPREGGDYFKPISFR